MFLGKLNKIYLITGLYILFISKLPAADAGMPQFNSSSFYSQLFWLTLTFAILYVIVTYILLPRIRENIRLRKNKIANDLERSENIKVEIEKMIAQSNARIDEAKNQVKQMIKKSINRSSTEYTNQLETIKKQLLNKQIDTEQNLEAYRKTIEKDLSKAVISLSAIILNRLDYKNLSTEEIHTILKDFNTGKNA